MLRTAMQATAQAAFGRSTTPAAVAGAISAMSTATPAPKLQVFRGTSNNPWFNLATEEWLYRDFNATGVETLFLWRNEPTIVIGRNQNPWKECKVQDMEAAEVMLARRLSGGGAVYQDLGNTNFTFLSARNAYSVDQNFAVITRALADLGVTAHQTGRNDVTVDGAKVSGSAFRLGTDSAFHHGTLLLDVDLSVLGSLLNPDKAKLASKGISSVKSRVANLADLVPGLDHDRISTVLIEAFADAYGQTLDDVTIDTLDTAVLEQNVDLAKYYADFADWNWRFGKSPVFEHELNVRFDWGGFDLHIDSAGGQITDLALYSDCLQPELVDALRSALTGTNYDTGAVGAALDAAQEALEAAGHHPAAAHVPEFKAWLTAAL